MNGFLVLFCGSADDLPVRLFEGRDEAFTFAESITGVDDPQLNRIKSVTGRDLGTECCVVVVEYRKGEPTDYTVAKDFDGDADDDDSDLDLDDEFDSEIEFEDDAAEAFDEADKGMGNDA